MRITIVGILLLLATAVVAKDKAPRPPKDDETGKYTYQGVAKVEGVDADVLYSRAKAWIATAYTSANDVIQLDDQEAGRIIVKGNFPFTALGNEFWIDHTLTVEIRDSRYRYTLTDFVVDGRRPMEDERQLMGIRKRAFSALIAQSKKTLAQLEVAMSKIEEDW